MGSLALLIAPTVVFLVFVVPYMASNVSPVFWVVRCVCSPDNKIVSCTASVSCYRRVSRLLHNQPLPLVVCCSANNSSNLCFCCNLHFLQNSGVPCKMIHPASAAAASCQQCLLHGPAFNPHPSTQLTCLFCLLHPMSFIAAAAASCRCSVAAC